GGARIKPGDVYYTISQQIGALLADHGAPIRTGAGPGIMTAGPEGFKAALKKLPTKATDVDSKDALHPVVSGMTDAVSATKTQGFRIKLPFEQDWSDSIDVGAEARLFPYRKLALYENCKGVAVFPGGYGTLDELFEVWAHGEAGAFHKPMAAVGVEFWKAILDPIKDVAVEGGTGRALIPAAEWDKLLLTDDPQQLVGHFEGAASTTKLYEKKPLERAHKLSREIDESIAVLDRLPASVTFLGGRRLADDDRALGVATSMAKELAALGVPLRVGSGGVVAEAVCAGAGKDTRVQGLLLGGLEGTRDLPNLTVHQQVTDVVTHKEIIGRKSQAFVALPGGLNTLGEVFSVLTQIQTGHLPKIPVVLVGKDYWQPIFTALRDKMLSPERQTISPHDLDLVTITDDPAEALAVMTPQLSSSTAPQLCLLDPQQAQTLLTGSTTTMLNPPGTAMASWLVGAPRGGNVVAADAAFDPALSKQFVQERVPPSLFAALETAHVDHRHTAWALDHGVDVNAITTLLGKGAGPEAFRFLYACAPLSAYRSVADAAGRIADRWGGDAEVVFRRLV
ncbi:MAG TPA: LOG family protein, partial [Myxococcota bacterium]